MENPEYILERWHRTKRFFVLLPFVVIGITGFNLWQDAQAGQPFDHTMLLVGLGMLLFIGILFICSWLIYKFLFRSTSHEQRRR